MPTKKLRDLFANKKALEEKRKELKEKALEKRESIPEEELDDTIKKIEDIDKQLKDVVDEIKAEKSDVKDDEDDAEDVDGEPNKKEERVMKKIIRYNDKMSNEETRSTIEYRKQFMDFVQRGVKGDLLQFREDSHTSTTTATTVIPTTVMEEIIKESKISGNVLSKVRKMNVKGGVKFSTLAAIPTASWIDEDTPSDRQKLDTGSVTFSYYGLEVKIAQSLLSEYVSIDAFEKEFAILAVEAMTNAKEVAVFNGSGSGQPTGIFKTSGVNVVVLKEAELGKYNKVVEAAGKLPVGYRTGAEWFMASATWDMIVGMVDNNGQPVARVNYGLDGMTQTFLGYPVNLVEVDRIKDFASATAGTDYFAVLGNMKYYAINSNGNLGVYKYRDEDKNQDITKALEFCDGKVLNAKAFLVLKKGTTSTTPTNG